MSNYATKVNVPKHQIKRILAMKFLHHPSLHIEIRYTECRDTMVDTNNVTRSQPINTVYNLSSARKYLH